MAAMGDSSRLMAGIVDLQGVVQSLANGRRSGVLTVTSGSESRHLRFAGGQLVALTGMRPDVFTRALCWTGVTSRAQINQVISSLPEGAGPEDLLGTLLSSTVLTSDAVLDACDCLIEEEITIILGWPTPTLDFTDMGTNDAFAEAQLRVGVSLSPNSLLLEGMRRQDELGTVYDLLPQHWDTLLRDEAVEIPDTLSDDARLLLNEWREGVVCGALFEDPRLPPFRATMAVAQLRRTGVVKVSTPAQLLVQADNAKAQGSLRKALGLYRRALELGQSSPRVHLQIAELAERFGDRSGAAQACLAAAGELADPSQAASALSNAMRLGADREGPLAQLVAIHIQLDQIDQAVGNLFELARIYERRKAFDQALQAVREAQELGADAATAALLLSRIAQGQGDREQSILHLEVAARAFHEEDKLEEAVTAWRELVRLCPERFDYARECAELVMWTGDRDGAATVLKAILGRLRPGSVAAPSDDVLLPMFELLAKLDPGHVMAHDWLAHTYEDRRDRDGATAQLTLAAQAQEKAGDYPGLVATLEKIIVLDAQRVEAHEWLGRARLALHQEGPAAEAWCIAADLSLARSLRKEARSLLEAAVAKLPTHAGLRARLAQVANRDADRATALRHFQAAADLGLGAGDMVVARDSLMQIARMRPDDVPVRVRLAEVVVTLKDPGTDRMLTDLVRVAVRTNNLGLALDHARRRLDLLGPGLHREARSELVELLRRVGDHAAELIAGKELLSGLLENGEFEPAVELLGRLVASHPQEAELVLQLAEAHQALDNVTQASRLLRHGVCLLQMENRLADAQKVLGQLAAIDGEADLVEAARSAMDAGVAIDWDKLRLELAQRKRMAERHATDGQRRPTTRTTPIGTPASITRSHAGGGSGYRPGVVDPGAVVRAALVPNNESPSASHEDLGRIER
jgi:tetratricopeptide (TPR) repeat protein